MNQSRGEQSSVSGPTPAPLEMTANLTHDQRMHQPDGSVSYFRYVSRLPGFQRMLQPWRNQRAGQVRVFSAELGSLLLKRHDQVDPASSNLASRFTNELNTRRKGEEAKLFLVEDLSPPLIEILWKFFDYPEPDIFAVHLHTVNHQHMFDPRNRMINAKLFEKLPPLIGSKTFTSISWLRPGGAISSSANISNIDNLLRARNIPPHPSTCAEWNATKSWYEAQGLVIGASIRTNIYRDFVSLTPNPSLGLMYHPRNKFVFWREQATVLVRENGDVPNILFLLDLPPQIIWLESPSNYSHRTGNPDDGHISPNQVTADPVLCPHRDQRVPISLTLDALYKHSNESVECHLEDLYKSLHKLHTTGDDVLHFLENLRHKGRRLSVQEILLSLLEVVAMDHMDTFKLIERILDIIVHASLDENVLQEALQYWRELFQEIEHILSYLTDDFANFVASQNPNHLSEATDKILNLVTLRGDRVMKKLRQVTTDIRADMGLVESKRGIQEAESVTRLTELAFIFIPLTFVSSLFSMQIKELQNGIPWTTFLAVATTAVAGLYGTRLCLRSQRFKRWKSNLLSNARDGRHLHPSEPLPSRDFLKYALGRSLESWEDYLYSFNRWGVAVGAALCIAPIITMWQREQLDTGYKVVMTIFFITCGLFFLFCVWFKYHSKSKHYILKAIRVYTRGRRRHRHVAGSPNTRTV